MFGKEMKETPVTVMTFSTESEQLSLDRWKIHPRCHENGTPLVARSPKVLQPVNPHRDVLRRRLAHGDSVSEARIPLDIHWIYIGLLRLSFLLRAKLSYGSL